MSGARGLTLLEVLIASLLGLALFAVMLGIFKRVSSAGRLGESRLGNQLRARQAARRLVPLLRFATAPNSTRSGLYHPDFADTAANVVFAVPEDLLDPEAAAFDPRHPSYYLCQIRHEAWSGKLILEDFYVPARTHTLALDIAAFNVTRTHLNGLTLRLRTRSEVRDERGFTRVVEYPLEESVEIPQ